MSFLGRALSSAVQALFLSSVLLTTCLASSDPWDAPAFSASPEALRLAAAAIKAEKDADVTVLLSEQRYSFDAQGREVEIDHSIYRIENEEGVKGWAETSGRWEPWRQAKPEIRARVITADMTVHVLDPKTLNDVPVHQNDPEVYSDRRAYGGPLPAVAVGAIIEEEITTRDTAAFFAAGAVERLALGQSVPVNKSRVVLSHPDSLPLHYALHLLPNASVAKAGNMGVETIIIENGPLDAYTDLPSHLPPDAVLRPEVEFGTGTTWQRVAAEYARLANDKMRLEDVQPVLARINTKEGSRIEVIRRIVAALHKSVRYTGIEFGESSLVPQFPSETLKRKYGDCKDKSTLLASMLHAAGIPAYLALVDSGPGQELNPELAGMGMFDHAIVYVPASGSDPELWIDATANYSRVGDLPSMDYGRWTLIVDEKTTSLTKIPDFTAAQNLHRETREFTLAEYGPAKIVETNEQIGPEESEFREYYLKDAKELREGSEKYVKEAYLADSLISLEKTEPSDLSRPFLVTYAAKGRRGYTDRENAVVYISQAALFDALPDYFTTPEETGKEDEPGKEKSTRKLPRTLDWQIEPYVSEWHYKIAAPAGFKLRALPPDKDEQLGSAHFTQKYTSNGEGTVAEAILRFDSGKSRLTVAEAKVLRDAVVKAREADFIVITFDQTAYALLAAGKVKDSLAAYRQLAALHPKEALHKTQLAQAYLRAGLGAKARTVAREATVLEPSSAGAFSTLGWIMEHDLIGRRFAKGFDYQAALDAYRTAMQLDPKEVDPQNKGTRADYAILLEYDSDGLRYTAKSHMDQAISEFKEIKKQDEESGKRYDDNVLYDLWYSGRYKELLEQVAALPGSETRKAFIIAATAAVEGPDTGIKKSFQITSEENDRSKALVAAGYMLLRSRRYPEAAALYSAGAPGQAESSRLRALAEVLRNAKPFEQMQMPESDPRAVIQRFMIFSLTIPFDPQDNLKLASARILELYESKALVDRVTRLFYSGRHTIETTQLPVEVAIDIVLSTAKYSQEGEENLGYRVAMQSPNSPGRLFFVVREDGKYKLVNFLGFNDLAREALARLEQNDLAGARKWLDWTRENVRLGGGDDPLDGPIFPRFWTKGQEGDAATIRLAALSALASTRFIAAYIPEFIHARDAAKDAAERTRLNLVLAEAYRSQKRWNELLAVAQELVKAYPDSNHAFEIAVTAFSGLKDFDQWDQLLQVRLQKHADEPDYVRSKAALDLFRGDVMQSRALLKGLIDSGKATSSDLNQFAWDALLPPAKVDAGAVEAAEKGNSLTQNANFDIMHTLACLYAGQGKTKEARELLLKAMDVAGLSEPDSPTWLALAMIAEQYGETDAAQAMYARVEKPEVDAPGSSYGIAQQRLAELRTTAAAAKSASH